ncbi:MAG: SMP-30/gluconolactonase/LRE family protein [Myxococcota bacterium]
MRKIILFGIVGTGVLALGCGLYLTLWPVPIDPIAWQPPLAPSPTGIWAPNTGLANVNRLDVPVGDYGPEDLHVLGDQIYGGTAHGAILRWSLDGGPPVEVVNTGGRPLGLHHDPQNRLVIADAVKGLIRLEPDHSLTTLCTHATDGTALALTDDLDVQADGTIWFSDASAIRGHTEWKQEILESRANGRLLRWRPSAPGCEVVQSGFFFANGVALAADESFVLINETSRYRVIRRWLTGAKAGTTDVFIDALPGFPDGISVDDQGHFWVAIASPRNGTVDALAGRPWLRSVIQRLPDAVQPRPARHPFVIELDGNGAVVRTLQDPQGKSYGLITSVQPHGDRLYLGSLSEPAAAWVAKP